MKKLEPLKTKIYLESCALLKKLDDRGFYKFFSEKVDSELKKNAATQNSFARILTAIGPLDTFNVLTGFKKIFESDFAGVIDIRTGCFLRAVKFTFLFRKERVEQEVVDSCFVCGLDILQALQCSGIALVFEDLVSLEKAVFASQYYIGNSFLQNYDKVLEVEYKVLVAALNAKVKRQSVGDAVAKELYAQSREQDPYDYLNQQFENIWKLAIKHFKKENDDYFGTPEAALFPTHLIGIAKELVKEGRIELNGTYSWELLVKAAMQSDNSTIKIEDRFLKIKALMIEH